MTAMTAMSMFEVDGPQSNQTMAICNYFHPMHAYTQMDICTYTCVYIYIYTFIYTYICTTYINTYIITYRLQIHVYIYRHRLKGKTTVSYIFYKHIQIIYRKLLCLKGPGLVQRLDSINGLATCHWFLGNSRGI